MSAPRSDDDRREAALHHATELGIAAINSTGRTDNVAAMIVRAAEQFHGFLSGKPSADDNPASSG